jgi:hypothetical protein
MWWHAIVVVAYCTTALQIDAAPHNVRITIYKTSDKEKEEARDKEINNALLAVCTHLLTNLATLALRPDIAAAPLTLIIQTAHLILNAAHTILKKRNGERLQPSFNIQSLVFDLGLPKKNGSTFQDNNHSIMLGTHHYARGNS